MLSVTFFAGDQSDTRPIHRHELEWHELRPLLEAATVRGPKRSGGYLIGSRTADGARRANATCGPATVLIVDYDDFVGEPDWSAWPGEILAHSSGSHLQVCDDNPTGAQRWRVYVRLAEPIPPEDYARVRDALPLPPGAHVRALSQPAFLPTFEADPPEWVEVPGAPLAWRSLPLPPSDGTSRLDPEHLTEEIAYSDPEVRARLEQLLLVSKRPTRDGDQLLWAAACDLRTRYRASEESTVAVLQAWHAAVLPDIDWPEHRVHRAAERAGWQVPAPMAPAPALVVEPAGGARLPPCPIEAFPPVIQDWIRATEEWHRTTSFGLIATCVLGAMSAAVQGRVFVDAGYPVPTALYLIGAVPAGGGKSPAFRDSFAPILAWERHQREAGRGALYLQQQRREDLEAQRAALAKERKNLVERPDGRHQPKGTATRPRGEELIEEIAALDEQLAAPAPQEFRYLVQDATPQALATLFALYGRLVCMSGEGHEVFQTICGTKYAKSQDSMGSDLNVLLEAYDGTAVRVDRTSRETQRAERACLSICLGLQHEPLDRALRDQALLERGMLDRFCFARTEYGRRWASADDCPRPVDAATADGYQRILGAMLALPEGVLRMSPEADALWRGYRYECSQQPAMVGWYSKHAYRAVRIAGVLAAADGAAEVTQGHVARSLLLCRWYAAHAQLAFGEVPGADLARQIAEHVRSVGGSCTRRELLRRFTATLEQLAPALELAEALELIRVEVSGRSVKIFV